LTETVHDPETILCIGVSLICGLSVPFRRQFIALWNSVAYFVGLSQVPLRGYVTMFSLRFELRNLGLTELGMRWLLLRSL
jgi:hypothetical protein